MQHSRIFTYIIVTVSMLASYQPLNARVFTVTTAADAGPGSLRDAIEALNVLPETHVIEFDIRDQLQEGPYTIDLLTPLPKIQQQVYVDGYSQRNAEVATETQPAALQVVINGAKIVASQLALIDEPVAGMWFADGSSQSVVAGLAFVGFKFGGSSETVSHKNSPVVGTGLVLATDNITVWGSWVGLHPADWLGFPNDYGILVGGNNNTIGGKFVAERVVVSNNVQLGIDISPLIVAGQAQVTLESAAENALQGIYVGTDPLGLVAIPNGGGALITGRANRVEFSSVISANVTFGLRLEGDENLVLASTIGPNATGDDVVLSANQVRGVMLFGADNLICSSHIADNKDAGIFFGETSTGAHVARNVIGTTAAGDFALGSQRFGIVLDGNNHLIGGEAREAGNLISGHVEDGILFVAGEHTVANNLIGTDKTGCFEIPNGHDGINGILDLGALDERKTRQLPEAFLTVTDNLISGNAVTGLRIRRGTVLIENNTVGLNNSEDGALPNKEKGIAIDGDSIAYITSNLVGFNGDLELPLDSHSGIGVNLPARAAILMTPSHSNIANGIGIFFEPDQVAQTPVTPAPELLSALSFGAAVAVTGRVADALPNRFYRVEFFSNNVEREFVTQGTDHIGTLETIETDEFGNAEFSVFFEQLDSFIPFVAATATLLEEGEEADVFAPVTTSEFSFNVAVQ